MAEPNTLVIADLLLLQQQLRSKSSLAELGYFLVNDSQKLAPYQIGVFYRQFRHQQKIEAISGIPLPVKDAPFYIWLNRLCHELTKKAITEPTVIKSADFDTAINANWDEFLPPSVLWLPLRSVDDTSLGGLLFARITAWKPEELGLLHYWADAVSHSVELLSHKKPALFAGLTKTKTSVWLVLAAGLAALLFMPISLSVLAKAEVVPKQPLVIRAPLDGIIDKVYAQPNTMITKDQLLLTLDDTPLKSRLDVAKQELEIAKAEYRRAEQASVIDRKASSEMPMLAARIEQRGAEVAYVESLLLRINIHAEQSGIAIIPDAYELEGKPVKIGERLLTIAKLEQAELEIWLAVGDSIPLPEQADVELFLNVSPESPYSAQLRYVNFQAEMSPEGIYAFRARADFPDATHLPRIGLRGTAKIYGASVPLYYYLFRRPFAAARQWLGL